MSAQVGPRTFTEDIPTHFLPNGKRVLSHYIRHELTEEGMQIIHGAYASLYGGQSRERIQERGGLFASEVAHFIDKGALPPDFDWRQYIVKP
jgi:hypothetical protein